MTSSDHGRQSGIQFEVLSAVHRRQCVTILADAFLNRNEPVCSHFHPYAYVKRLEYLVDKTARNGLSCVAVDTNKHRRVVSVCLNEDSKDKASPEFTAYFRRLTAENNETQDYELMYAMVDDLRDQCNSLQDQLAKYKTYYISLLATDREYANKGIAKNLLNYSLHSIAIPKGYKYAFTEATNDFSMKCFTKCGFKVAAKLRYDNWQHPPNSDVYPKREIANKTGFHYMYLMDRMLATHSRCKL